MKVGDPRSRVYRPSVVIDFRIRFDERLRRVVSSPLSPEDLAASGGAEPGKGATVPLFAAGSSEELTQVVGVVPSSASIDLSGVRQAGRWSATVLYRDLPVPPEAVRAGAALIHVGCVDDGEYGSRLSAGRSAALDTRDAAGNPRMDTLVMLGVVDTWDVSDGDGPSTVSLSGRDQTGILLDSPWPADAFDRLDLTADIGQVVKQVLSFHPFGADMVPFVEVAPAKEWPGGSVPSPDTEGSSARHRRGAAGDKTPRRTGKATGDLKFWDVITRLCLLVGAAPYFRGVHLRIVPMRSLFEQVGGGTTPFAGGGPRVEGGEEITVRRLVYGRDVKRLSVSRKLSGVKAQVVEVVSADPDSPNRSERLRRVRWPDGGKTNDGPLATSVASSGASSQDVLRVSVPGLKDEAAMRRVAASVFEEVMRGETTGTVEASDLASFGGSAADPDMLRLRPGEAIQIVRDARQRGALPEAQAHVRRGFEEEVQEVKKRVGSEPFARLVTAIRRGELGQITPYYYVNGVKYAWDGSRLNVSLDFRNYVSAVMDTGAPS